MGHKNEAGYIMGHPMDECEYSCCPLFCTANQSPYPAMNPCPECYATDRRITPLLHPEACLLHHRQYVCSTCGRAICADVDDKGRFRALFPFRSIEVAQLYLRAAEVIRQCPCGIYEIIGTNGRRQYKIFASADELRAYLAKHRDKRCPTSTPRFATPHDKPGEATHRLRRLTPDEVDQYMRERRQTKNEKPGT